MRRREDRKKRGGNEKVNRRAGERRRELGIEKGKGSYALKAQSTHTPATNPCPSAPPLCFPPQLPSRDYSKHQFERDCNRCDLNIKYILSVLF